MLHTVLALTHVKSSLTRRLQVDIVIGADGANSRVAKEIDAGDYDYAIAFQVQQTYILTIMSAWRLCHAAVDILTRSDMLASMRKWQACCRSSASPCFALASRCTCSPLLPVQLCSHRARCMFICTEVCTDWLKCCLAPLQVHIHTSEVEQDTRSHLCMSTLHPHGLTPALHEASLNPPCAPAGANSHPRRQDGLLQGPRRDVRGRRCVPRLLRLGVPQV